MNLGRLGCPRFFLGIGFLGFLLTDTGRVRLGWRILLFLVLTAVGIRWLVSFVVPSRVAPGCAADSLVGCAPGRMGLPGLGWKGPRALGSTWPRGRKELALGLLLGVVVAGMVAVGMVGFGVLRWSADAGDGLDYLRDEWSSPCGFHRAGSRRGGPDAGLPPSGSGGGLGGGVGSVDHLYPFRDPSSGESRTTSWIGLANIVVAGFSWGSST